MEIFVLFKKIGRILFLFTTIIKLRIVTFFHVLSLNLFIFLQSPLQYQVQSFEAVIEFQIIYVFQFENALLQITFT